MILVVNAGSSSIKVALFAPDVSPVMTAAVTEIGGVGLLKIGARTRPVTTANHDAALALILDALAQASHPPGRLTAAAHRVVHGGAALTAPACLTPDVIATITACVPLAPLHNPANLAAIHALSRLAPDLPQCASFDTAFHATNPEVATTYALPPAERARGLRRFGFHGISYAGLVSRITPLPRRLLALHLGNGSSVCAILDGKSVATSMGYSPLDGLVMGTRTGSIDGMAVLQLARDHGIDGAGDILNRHSGLLALAGTNDMRAILESAAKGEAAAVFAIDHFCYWAIRHAGSAIAAMGGIDALAFTGGIGENAGAIRDRIVAGLVWAGDVPVHVIRAEEERQIAADAVLALDAV